MIERKLNAYIETVTQKTNNQERPFQLEVKIDGHVVSFFEFPDYWEESSYPNIISYLIRSAVCNHFGPENWEG